MLPYNVKKNSDGKYGGLLPYCLSCKRTVIFTRAAVFRISQLNWDRLNDEPKGEHRCLAYLEDYDVWCHIKIYRFWVVSYSVIKDQETLKQIEEDFLS